MTHPVYWDDFINDNGTDFDEKFDLFMKSIQDVIDKYVTSKIVRFKKSKHKKSEWITTGIVNSIKVKDNLYRKMKKISSSHPNYTIQ